MSDPRPHAPAALFFAFLALVLTWPLCRQLATHVPGLSADDNMTFLWNFWWMRHALPVGLTHFFRTGYLFHPIGADLVLHAHTALSAFVGATLLRRWPIVTALDLTILISCALNGFAAYVLAFRVTRRRLASVVAGLYFASCPGLTDFLFGRFNYYSAWGLPLFAAAFLGALDSQPGAAPAAAQGGLGAEPTNRKWFHLAALSGVMLAAVAYTDYYYVVYLLVFVMCATAWRLIRLEWPPTTEPVRRTSFDRVLAGIVGASVIIAIAIRLTGGRVFHAGIFTISVTTSFNVRAVGWIALIWWLYRRMKRPFVLEIDRANLRAASPVIAVTVAVFGVLVAPIASHAAFVWWTGGYATQVYYWRSAPRGIDLASLLLGNPYQPLWGPLVRRVYTAGGMELSPLWVGVGPMLALAVTRKRWWPEEAARFWVAVGSVFFVWALGPYLTILGTNTALVLPGILLRYVPIVSNARIPAHASVFVYLAVAVLLAIALTSVPSPRTRTVQLAVAAAILVDFCSVPFPTYRLDEPSVYSRLRSLPPGALLEIPFGVRDGFGEVGHLDTRTMYYQSIHEKPLVGGYISRLPPSVKAFYRESAIFDAILRLSSPEDSHSTIIPESGPATAAILKGQGIRYLVVNTDTASPSLQRYVASIPKRLVDRDDGRDLYQLER